jgi:SAM-dependent methyltransferase
MPLPESATRHSPARQRPADSLAEVVKRKLFHIQDRLFELHSGIDVGGIIEGGELIAGDSDSRRHATAYQAVWSRNLGELLGESRKMGCGFDTFVDIGSGKGKACFYARSKGGFRRIIGVEFSAPLVVVANANKRRLRADDVDFVEADAIEYRLPDSNNLVFLFNPFDAVVLERFLENNLEHFRVQSAIAYANDAERRSLLKFGFETVFRDQTRRISLHRHPAAG